MLLALLFYAMPLLCLGTIVLVVRGAFTESEGQNHRWRLKPLMISAIAIALTIICMGWVRQHFKAEGERMRADPFSYWDGIPAKCPITVSFLNQSNHADGTRVASFVLSNRRAQKVTIITDAAGLPYYAVYEAFRNPVATNLSITITNHTLQEFLRSKTATLQPRSNIAFPVRIAAKVTNEMIIIDYMTPKSRVSELISEGLELLRLKRPGEAFAKYPIREPFGGQTK